MDLITRDLLERNIDICGYGLNLFTELFPEGAKVNITNLRKARKRDAGAASIVAGFLSVTRYSQYRKQLAEDENNLHKLKHKLRNSKEIKKDKNYKALVLKLRAAEKTYEKAENALYKAQDKVEEFECAHEDKLSKLLAQEQEQVLKQSDKLLIELLKEETV